MKKLTLIGLVLTMVHSTSMGQNWREMIADPNANFQDIQAAFYAEFGDEPGARGSGWKQFKRWEWFMEQRLNDRGEMPNARLVYEEVKRASLQEQYRGGNGDWQLIGPIEEPQNGNGNSIGRLSAIAFHPTDTMQMWAGAPSGGMWKSNDNGQSWSPLTDDLLNIGVAEIVINPHHPDTMYMASGDESVDDTYSFGVMKSTDGGQTWDTTGLSFNVIQSRNIRRMIIDSTNTNVLIAATTHGIFRTADAGATWQLVRSGSFCDIEFKPYSNDTVYATTNSTGLEAFYISYDNGQNWVASSNGMNNSAMRRVKVAVSPADPDVVYVLASASNSSLQGLYKSNDAGQSWSLVCDSPNMMAGDEFGADDGGQGWYSMELAVSPTNADEVRIGGINIWKSTDGGSTFFLEAHWYAANGIYVHADLHRMVYHPNTGQFYAGCDGGLYRRSHYFNGYECISSGMSITQFYRLANSASDPTIILGGAQDNGTFRWKNNLWMAVLGGDGMESMISPEDPNVVYSTIQNGVLQKSTDGGNNYGPDIAPAPGAWVTPFMMEPGNPDVVYAASGTRVYRSDVAGSDWYEMSPTLTTINSGSLTLLDVSHTNEEYVVSGSRSTLYLTKDLGGAWVNIKSGLPSVGMTYVAFDPLEENTIWVTFSGYTEGQKVYRSMDAGETWQNMSMNLPNLPVNCVEIERSSTGGVYVGTDVGIYYWDENLTEWEPFMTGLPNVIVNELEIHEATNTIRAATYGRGLWESPTRNFINVGIEEQSTATPKTVEIWPNPSSDFVNVKFDDHNSICDFNLLDAYGRTVRSSLNPSKQNSVQTDIRDLSIGVYYLSDLNHELIGRIIVSRH